MTRGLPICPACQAAGIRYRVKDVAHYFQVDGRMRVSTGHTRKITAWVRCRRPVGYFSGGPACGWTWWSRHPAILLLARRHPNAKLLRPYEQPPRGAKPAGGRKGLVHA